MLKSLIPKMPRSLSIHAHRKVKSLYKWGVVEAMGMGVCWLWKCIEICIVFSDTLQTDSAVVVFNKSFCGKLLDYQIICYETTPDINKIKSWSQDELTLAHTLDTVGQILQAPGKLINFHVISPLCNKTKVGVLQKKCPKLFLHYYGYFPGASAGWLHNHNFWFLHTAKRRQGGRQPPYMGWTLDQLSYMSAPKKKDFFSNKYFTDFLVFSERGGRSRANLSPNAVPPA